MQLPQFAPNISGCLRVGCHQNQAVVAQDVPVLCLMLGLSSRADLQDRVGLQLALQCSVHGLAQREGILMDCMVRAGDGSTIKGAIIDSNACIGQNVRVTNAEGVRESDRTKDGFVINDGIICVLKNAVIPDGTQI